MFENLNKYQNLNFLTGDSPEDLLRQIQSIRLPTQVLQIYGMNGKHYAWILTEAKIVKKPKGGTASNTDKKREA